MNTIEIWLKAFRLRTLPLSLSATILGSFLGYSQDRFKWQVFIFASLTTLFLQILSNLANDYGDALKGSDDKNRVGPRRITQSGLVTHSQIRFMIGVFAVLSLISGTLLIFFGLGKYSIFAYGIFFTLGFTATFAAIKYTIGKKPYGYVGLGDLMVFLYFGLLGVGGTFFLHTLTFHWTILLPAAAIGLLSVGVLNLNNSRDCENDKVNHKMTLVVRIGVQWAKVYHTVLLIFSFLLGSAYTILHYESAFQLVFLLTLPLLVSDAKTVISNTVPVELNDELKKLAMITLIFALSFGLGQVL